MDSGAEGEIMFELQSRIDSRSDNAVFLLASTSLILWFGAEWYQEPGLEGETTCELSVHSQLQDRNCTQHTEKSSEIIFWPLSSQTILLDIVLVDTNYKRSD